MRHTTKKTFIYVWSSLYIALFLVLMSLGQLFGYEDMPLVIDGWGLLPSGLGVVVAACLVLLQVMALPAALMMPLSSQLRLFSSTAGWVVLVAWACISLTLLISGRAGVNSGIFGSHILVPAGLWLSGFVAVLIALRIVVSLEFRNR